MLGKSTDRKGASHCVGSRKSIAITVYRYEVMRASTVLRGERLLAFEMRSAEHAVQAETPLDLRYFRDGRQPCVAASRVGPEEHGVDMSLTECVGTRNTGVTSRSRPTDANSKAE